MIFNVATLLSKNVGETRKHSFKLENFSAEKQDFIDIVCQITMIKTHKNILVYGEIGAKYKDYCDRCLQSIIMNLETYIEEEFITTYNNKDLISQNDFYDTNKYVIDIYNQINLYEILKDYLLSVIPIKKLCGDNCLGLCKVCLVNLNLNKCICA